MRSISEVMALNNVAAEVGRLTTPARDLEVLIEELEERGFPDRRMQSVDLLSQ